ncbi:UPF0481 protein At3g47200-like [Olea europaea var. sylvestris]|uniref:UPF0481 protein At3g47200-like n=1 Tax=Olea europaea var. sylvestris TaxID=158386 RepID=UPI000C1D3E1A|nr:UPF0481 protein At3g47200-like [Olea europaea var. sylvestris]
MSMQFYANIQGMTTVGTKGDNQSAEITQTDPKSQESSSSISKSKDEWLNFVENYVHDTTDKPQIQRVPSLLRDIESNKKCYEPLLVSIGPYHHGQPGLEEFEQLKIAIAQKLCHDHSSHQVSLERLYEEVAKVGKSARKCYKKGSTENYDDRSFNKIMFLDACFVLQIILFVTRRNLTEEDLLRPSGHQLLVIVRYDLFLLENQIPLLVLKVLMDSMFEDEIGRELIQDFLQTAHIMSPQEKEKLEIDTEAPHLLYLFRERLIWSSPEDKNEKKCFKRLLHLLREWLIGSSPEDKNKLIEPSPEDKNEKKCFKRLLHLLPEWLVESSPEDKNKENFVEWYSYRSVTELKSAGIHFRPSHTDPFTDVKFKSHLISGTLTLSPIVVEDSTKSLSNLAAYETSLNGPYDYRIMSYICLMDSLIDHVDDVKELRKRKILLNNLGSDEELARLFNEISNNLAFDGDVYGDVRTQIEKHCQSKAQVWMAEWIHDHFRSHWAFLAFMGAMFIIALTTVQTYFAVFPHYKTS